MAVLEVLHHVVEKLQSAAALVYEVKPYNPYSPSTLLLHFRMGLLFKWWELIIDLPDGGARNPLDIHVASDAAAPVHCRPNFLRGAIQ